MHIVGDSKGETTYSREIQIDRLSLTSNITMSLTVSVPHVTHSAVGRLCTEATYITDLDLDMTARLFHVHNHCLRHRPSHVVCKYSCPPPRRRQVLLTSLAGQRKQYIGGDFLGSYMKPARVMTSRHPMTSRVRTMLLQINLVEHNLLYPNTSVTSLCCRRHGLSLLLH